MVLRTEPGVWCMPGKHSTVDCGATPQVLCLLLMGDKIEPHLVVLLQLPELGPRVSGATPGSPAPLTSVFMLPLNMLILQKKT